MHDAAYEWVARFATDNGARTVLDIGGRNINGTAATLFPDARYVSVDLYPGPGVDVVIDVTEWESDEVFDYVVCCEVLEHAENWLQILRTGYARCREGGTFIMTCAGPGREPHSGVDGGSLRSGEYYGNIAADELEKELAAIGWTTFTTNVDGFDVRCVAVR